MQEIYEAVEKILEPYDDILTRNDLAKIFGCSYNQVPAELEKRNIKTLANNGKWGHIKIHKEIMKNVLINEYTK